MLLVMLVLVLLWAVAGAVLMLVLVLPVVLVLLVLSQWPISCVSSSIILDCCCRPTWRGKMAK